MTKKHSGPDFEDVCMFCAKDITISHQNEWIHVHDRKGPCPEAQAAGYGWASPRALSYEEKLARNKK